MPVFSGAKLREARKNAGLRVEHLAVAADRCSAAITHYENGFREPPASIVGKLADALGVGVADLYADDREQVPA